MYFTKGSPNISSIHQAPYSYYNILNYIPMLYFPSPWLLCHAQAVPLNPFTSFTQPPAQSICCNFESVFVLFVSLFCFHMKVMSCGICPLTN